MACGDPPVGGVAYDGVSLRSTWAPCGCWTGPWFGTVNPPQCPTHLGDVWVGVTQPTYTAPGLSYADVERIARRVVELLKAAP